MTPLAALTTSGSALADIADWVFTVVSTSQRFICEIAAGEPGRAIDTFLDDLPAPPTPVHDLLLRSVLARVALEYRPTATGRGGTRRTPGPTLDRTLRNLLGGTDDPRRAFEVWARRTLL